MKGVFVGPGSPTKDPWGHATLQLSTLVTFKESLEKNRSDPGDLMLAEGPKGTVANMLQRRLSQGSFNREWLCNPQGLQGLWTCPSLSAPVANANLSGAGWLARQDEPPCPTLRRILSWAFLPSWDIHLVCLINSWTFITHIRTTGEDRAWVATETSWRHRKRTGVEREEWEIEEPLAGLTL